MNTVNQNEINTGQIESVIDKPEIYLISNLVFYFQLFPFSQGTIFHEVLFMGINMGINMENSINKKYMHLSFTCLSTRETMSSKRDIISICAFFTKDSSFCRVRRTPSFCRQRWMSTRRLGYLWSIRVGSNEGRLIPVIMLQASYSGSCSVYSVDPLPEQVRYRILVES